MATEINYSQILANSNLKFYARFESGALTTDSSGEGHTLTAIKTPVSDDGKFGGDVVLGNVVDLDMTDGTTSYASTLTNYWQSQEIIPTKNYLGSIGVRMWKVGSPTGNLTIELQSDNADAPSGTVLATATYNSASLGTSVAEINIPIPYAVSAGTKYHICFKGQAAWDSSKQVRFETITETTSLHWRLGAGNFTDLDSVNSHISLKTYYGVVNSAYSATDHADLKPTGNFTIGAWIKSSNTSTNQSIFASLNYTGTVYTGIYLITRSASSGKLAFLSSKNSGKTADTDYKLLLGNTVVCDGNWHFVVGTWDGSKMYIYVDGTEDANVAWANAPVYGTVYQRVGCWFLSNSGVNEAFFTGSLDDVFLINGTALSAEQISSIYSGMANIKLNIGDAWKDAIGMQINIGDSWKTVSGANINIGDTFKTIF